MSQASCAVDTTADTSHSLDEVAVKDTLAELEKRQLAGFNSVTNNGLDFEIDVLLLHSLSRRIGKTAATGEDASEVGGVIENALLEGGKIKVAAVKQRLELLEGEDCINVGLDGLKLRLCLFSGTRSDEYHLGIGSRFLNVLRKKRRSVGCGNTGYEGTEY